MSMNPVEGSGSRSERNGSGHKSRLEQWHALGALPRTLKARANENPRAALVVVGATAFVMGGLVGSRLGRFALAACIPVVIARTLDGTLIKELVRFAKGDGVEAPST